MSQYADQRLLVAAPAALMLASAAAGQGLPPIQHSFSNGATLQFYGQINKGILQYDDGIDTRSYTLIDNDNSGTRAGLKYTRPSAPGSSRTSTNSAMRPIPPAT